MPLSAVLPFGLLIAAGGSVFYFRNRGSKMAMMAIVLGLLLSRFGIFMILLVMNSSM